MGNEKKKGTHRENCSAQILNAASPGTRESKIPYTRRIRSSCFWGTRRIIAINLEEEFLLIWKTGLNSHRTPNFKKR